MRTTLIGLLVAAAVVVGAAWYANRSPREAEVQPAGRAQDPVATESAVAHPGPESSTTSKLPMPAPDEMKLPGPAHADHNELVTSDPPPSAAGGPLLEGTEAESDVTARDELVTVPGDPSLAPSGRPQLESVPLESSGPSRSEELTDVPVPGQGNTSTR